MKSHLKSRQNSKLSVSEKSSKEIKQLAVSVAILEIIESDGLLGVTHSKVARKSKVSRAWIYEYIGKEKNSLIEFGADVFAAHLSRVALTAIPKTKEELKKQIEDGEKFLFDSVEQNPVIIKLYFRFRGTTNPVGKMIQKYETQWLKSAAKSVVEVLDLSPDSATLLVESILTLRLGFAHRVATSPDKQSARKNAENIFNFVQSMVSGALS